MVNKANNVKGNAMKRKKAKPSGRRSRIDAALAGAQTGRSTKKKKKKS